MNQLFDEIYESLTLARLPGIVSFEAATGRPLDELVAKNDYYFREGLAAQTYEENFAGGSLDAE